MKSSEEHETTACNDTIFRSTTVTHHVLPRPALSASTLCKLQTFRRCRLSPCRRGCVCSSRWVRASAFIVFHFHFGQRKQNPPHPYPVMLSWPDIRPTCGSSFATKAAMSPGQVWLQQEPASPVTLRFVG